MLSELDEAWALALAEAEQRARVAGRHDLAEYLALRNSNDLLRKTGIEWLLSTFADLAGQANRIGSAIQMESIDGHRFHISSATMVGRLLTLKSGVRTLFVEAGWPRTPRDGFVRGGGLACANIRHLGIRSASRQLLLLKSATGAPRWKLAGSPTSHIDEATIRHHLNILLDQEE
ncbi:MAG TPA: hypothetical protein VE135_18980 [Pyrinomonadaceae bacterium]|nr:hypothetical protein [Pyrinomonadaceae bacterium]